MIPTPPLKSSQSDPGSLNQKPIPPTNPSASSSSSSASAPPIRLWSNSSEREYWHNLADLYAILVTTERLEKAYIRDSISAHHYTPACTNLIAQFKTAMNLVEDHLSSMETFIKQYKMNCPLAVNRLLKMGIPATVEHAHQLTSPDQKNHAKVVAETVQHFITLMDSVKLGMVAVDQLHPLLSDLLSAMNKIGRQFDGIPKIRQWLIELNQMKASDTLSEDQARQLHFDLESAHTEFYRSLQ